MHQAAEIEGGNIEHKYRMMSDKSLLDCYSRAYGQAAAIADKMINLRNHGYDSRSLLSNALSPGKYFKAAPSNVAFFCHANEVSPAGQPKPFDYDLFNAQAARLFPVPLELPESFQRSKFIQNKKEVDENNTVELSSKSLHANRSACLKDKETKISDFGKGVLKRKCSTKDANVDGGIKPKKKPEVRPDAPAFRGHDPENMYIECHICHKRIKRLYHFHRHMRIHTGEKTHKCPYCNYKSVRKDNLKSHMKTHEKHFKSATFKQQCASRAAGCNSQNSEAKSMVLPPTRSETFREKLEFFNNHAKPYSRLANHIGEKNDAATKIDSFYPYRNTLNHEKMFLNSLLRPKISFDKSYNIAKMNFINNNLPSFLPSFFSVNPFYHNSKPQFKNFDFKNINCFHFNPY